MSQLDQHQLTLYSGHLMCDGLHTTSASPYHYTCEQGLESE